jgi:uroporphyrinogen-III decarboxylase
MNKIQALHNLAAQRPARNIWFPILAPTALSALSAQEFGIPFDEEEVMMDPATQIAVSEQLVNVLGLSIVAPFMDTQLEKKAVMHHFGEGLNWQDIKTFRHLDPAAIDAETNPYLRTRLDFATMAAQKLPGVANVGLACGPYTMLFSFFGPDWFMQEFHFDYATPELNEDAYYAFRFTSGLFVNFVSALTRRGIDTVCVTEPQMAIDRPAVVSKYGVAPVREAFQAVNTIGLPVVLHVCGNSERVWDVMKNTGAQGISLDKHVSMPKAAGTFTDEVILGNLCTMHVLPSGTEHDIFDAARTMTREMAPFEGRYIPTSACQIRSPMTLARLGAFGRGTQPGI